MSILVKICIMQKNGIAYKKIEITQDVYSSVLLTLKSKVDYLYLTIISITN